MRPRLGQGGGAGCRGKPGLNGLLVTLLVRAQRNRQRIFACGLSDHYRQIFELTRLDEVIAIHDTEEAAIAAAA